MDGELKQGDDYKTIWKYFRKNEITPLQCKDYLIFEDNRQSVVIQRNDDYRHIKKIRTYSSVTLLKDSLSVYVKGWDVFQVVEHFGLPSAVSTSQTLFTYFFEDGARFQIPFRADGTHLYEVL